MVGVPGRSKGCNTCIQRKIRCDQETPLCGNCRKSNRLCTGYKRRLGYVFSRDVNLSSPQEEPSREQTTVTYQGRWKRAKPRQAPLITPQHAGIPPSWLESLLSLSFAGNISAKPAMRQQYRYIFLGHHLPEDMREPHKMESIVPAHWLSQLQGLETRSPVLETCTTAFFASRVGRMNDDPNLVHQCRSAYVEGLRQLQQALANPVTRLSDETLAACMALSLYELTEPSVERQGAYMAHTKGAMALLQLRGPDACTSPLAHSLFRDLRGQEILISLLYRRQTFLSRPEWLERPWKSITKTPYDELINWLFSLPDVIGQFDAVAQETDHTKLRAGLHDIIEKYSEIDTVLQRLYANFDQSVSGPLYWAALSTLDSCVDNDQHGKAFPVSFHFPNFSIALIVATYWSNMMVVHIQLMYVYAKLAAVESPEDISGGAQDTQCSTAADSKSYEAMQFYERSREHASKWTTMAKNICQSGEYFMQDNMGAHGALSIITLLSGCYSCFENSPSDWSREINWIAEYMCRIKKKVNLPSRNLLES